MFSSQIDGLEISHNSKPFTQHDINTPHTAFLDTREVKMTSELSSNWKKLQAKIQQESSKPQGQKRKAEQDGISQTSQKSSKKTKIASQSSSARPKTQPSKVTKRKPPQKSTMGAVQSQISGPGRSGSLSLWAEANDISAEDISEAYGLGIRDNSMLTATAVKPNEGLAKGVEPGKFIAIDCEMVGIGEGGYEHALARVSVVDFHGRQVYDSYVRPKEHVTDWRTRISGIAPKHMATARDFDEVQTQIAQLFQGRILVGHDIRHDLDVLMLDHPRKDIRDTAKFSGFKKYGHGPKPALRVLARELLGVEIQTGQHSSIEDARVTMLLFRKHKPAFDVEHATRYPEYNPRSLEAKPKPKQKKTKKKRRN